MKRFNDWLAIKLGTLLSSVYFFYFCVVLDLIELGPVIASHSVITWITYISQTVIQLVALPILGAMQKVQEQHHDEHAAKLDAIHEHLGIKK